MRCYLNGEDASSGRPRAHEVGPGLLREAPRLGQTRACQCVWAPEGQGADGGGILRLRRRAEGARSAFGDVIRSPKNREEQGQEDKH